MQISEDDEGAKEIELSDDPYDCMRLNVENVPCVVTLCKVQHRHIPVPTMHLSCVCILFSVVVFVMYYLCHSDRSQTRGGRHPAGESVFSGQCSDISHTQRDGHMCEEDGQRQSGPREHL